MKYGTSHIYTWAMVCSDVHTMCRPESGGAAAASAACADR